jgi:multimeric flavodoxin WrbA
MTSEMKVFFDRITDYLNLPDLLDKGRRLRKMSAYVVCTSASEAVSPSFISTFRETFGYLGMRFGGFIHLNFADGYSEMESEDEISKFVAAVRRGVEVEN